MNLTNEEGKARLDCWVTFFEKMLGWPKAKTLDWARKYESWLVDDNSILFTESDFWDPLRELVKHSLKERLRPLEELNLLGIVDLELRNCRAKFELESNEFWNEAEEIVEKHLGPLKR